MRFTFKDRSVELRNKVLLMGVVNITPDSFSEDGDNLDSEIAVANALAMIRDGADIIDIGGESTRPSADSVSATVESDRALPVIRGLRAVTDIPISIDTYKADVAEAALASGADIINDISGFHRDPLMPAVARRFAAGCVVMHMRGTPKTMQRFTDYTDLIGEIHDYFRRSIGLLAKAGIPETSICLDPGIGFSKTAEQNLILIRNLTAFAGLGRPLLIGPSRKSFIGKTLGIESPRERIWGTAAAVSCGLCYGAHIIRVHDIKAMRQVIDMTTAITGAPATTGNGNSLNR